MDDHQHPKMKVDEAGNLWLNFGQYGQEVELACFSKDGSRLLTVEEVGVAKIFDTESSELISEIRPTSALTGNAKSPTTSEFEVYIEAAALNTDGKLALLGLNDGTAGVFEVSTGKRLSTLFQKDAPPEHWELIRAVNFSNDSSMALVGFYDRTVGVWDTTGEQLIARLRPDNAELYYSKDAWGRESLVSSVAASADNRYVFVGCMDFTCSIWDLEIKETVFTATEYKEEIICVCEVNDVIFWATAGGAVWKEDRNNRQGRSNEPEKLLTTNESWMEAKFAPSGNFVLARTMAGEIQKRNLLTGELEILASVRPTDTLENRTAFGFIDGDNYFYTPTDDSIKLDDITIKVIEQQEPQDTIKSVLLSPDKSILAIKTDWKGIELWDRATGEFIRKLPSDIRHYAFSNDSSKIAFCTTDTERGFIKIEDVRTGELVQRFIVHGINDVIFAFGLTDKTIITGSARDQTVRLWQREGSMNTSSTGVSSSESNSGKYVEVKKLTFDYCQDLIFAFQPNGNIVIGHKGGEVEVWSPDLRTKLCYAPLKMEYNTLWCIAENGAELVYAERGQVFARIDLTTGTISKFQPTLDRPEFVPNSKQDQDIVARAGALVWRQFGGPYVHITDGPRGWATPIHISRDQKLAVIPCYTEVVVLSLEKEEEEQQQEQVRARLPFEGRLRAAYVDNEKVMAVDSKGKLFAKNYGK
jgi:WD40 repeat protein